MLGVMWKDGETASFPHRTSAIEGREGGGEDIECLRLGWFKPYGEFAKERPNDSSECRLHPNCLRVPLWFLCWNMGSAWTAWFYDNHYDI